MFIRGADVHVVVVCVRQLHFSNVQYFRRYQLWRRASGRILSGLLRLPGGQCERPERRPRLRRERTREASTAPPAMPVLLEDKHEDEHAWKPVEKLPDPDDYIAPQAASQGKGAAKGRGGRAV